jgi:thiamine transport system ATP-binding protein
MRGGRIVQEGATAEVWSAPDDAETALFLGYPRVLTGSAAEALLRLADRPVAREVAVRASAVVAAPSGSGAPGLVRAARLTPDGARLVVDVEGIGELDAVGLAGWAPQAGERVVVRVAGHAIAPLGGAVPVGSGDVS